MYVRAAIVLMVVNFVLLIATIFLAHEVVRLRDQSHDALVTAQTSILNARRACDRGNELRRAVRFTLDREGAPEAMKSSSGVQHRDCVADYPLP